MLLSAFSGLIIGTEEAEASQVVITEAVRIVDGGTASDAQTTVASDSEGNVHVVWTRNNQHLYYSMLSPRGETLIDATQITNPGLHKVWHPDMVIDDNDRIHIVWADKSGQYKIMYTSLDPTSHLWMVWLLKTAESLKSMTPSFPCVLKIETGHQLMQIAKATFTLHGKIPTTNFRCFSTNLKSTIP